MDRIIGIDEIHNIEFEMLKNVNDICERNNITYFLQAGSVLGAIRHKGIIPWDEDIDIIIPINEYKAFRSAMSSELGEKYILQTCEDKDFKEFFMRVTLKNQDPLSAYLDVFFLIGAPSEETQQKAFLKRQKRIVELRYRRYLEPQLATTFSRKIARFILKASSNLIPLKTLNNMYFRLATSYNYDNSKFVHCSYGRYDMKNFFHKEVFNKAIKVEFEDMVLPIPNGYDTMLKQYYGDYMKYPPQHIIDAGLNHKTVIREQ